MNRYLLFAGFADGHDNGPWYSYLVGQFPTVQDAERAFAVFWEKERAGGEPTTYWMLNVQGDIYDVVLEKVVEDWVPEHRSWQVLVDWLPVRSTDL